MATESGKVYYDLSYCASMEATKCDLLIKKLSALKDYYAAQAKYYDELATIEDANKPYDFDLSI